MSHLYIFGGMSTALEIGEAASALGIHNIVHVVPPNEPHNGRTRLSIDELPEASNTSHRAGFILSMTDLRIREKCLAVAKSIGLRPQSIIHPNAWISPNAEIGHGTYAAAFSVVSAGAIVSEHCLLNFQALIGHDAKLGHNCRLNPGAKIGGNCTLGDRVLVGANSFLFQGCSIGEDCVIDAMTYVRNDLSAGQILSDHRNGGRPLKRPFA